MVVSISRHSSPCFSLTRPTWYKKSCISSSNIRQNKILSSSATAGALATGALTSAAPQQWHSQQRVQCSPDQSVLEHHEHKPQRQNNQYFFLSPSLAKQQDISFFLLAWLLVFFSLNLDLLCRVFTTLM